MALSPSLCLAHDHELDCDFDFGFGNFCCAHRNLTCLCPYPYSRDASHLYHHVFEVDHPFLSKADHLSEADHLVFLHLARS